MRIIAKQSDYYDYVMSYGQDPKVIYKREPRDIPFNDLSDDDKKIFKGTRFNYYKDYPVQAVVFIIAGETYKLFYRRHTEDVYGVPPKPLTQMAHIGTQFKDVGDDRDLYLFGRSRSDEKPFVQGNMDNMEFARRVGSPVIVYGLYQTYNIKDFMHHSTNIQGVRLNEYPDQHSRARIDMPILQYTGIVNYFGLDPQTTFMKISNFISQLGHKEPEGISNKSKIVKAGFDVKTSFRNTK